MNTIEKFMIRDKVCVITGGAGLLGIKHAESVLDGGGIPILLDISSAVYDVEKKLSIQYKSKVKGYVVDITNKTDVTSVKEQILNAYGSIDILINNAANNPKVEGDANGSNWTMFENFPISVWEQDFAVGLTGAFICSQVFGKVMKEKKSGVILNISSDLGIIAPDQRIYEQSVKPVTYSVVKHGLIGLTKYLATYWSKDNIRVNAICPGGVYNGQDEDFVKRLTNLIPMTRMADKDEYKAAVLFMISEASSYMTGSVVIIDGGRTCW